MVNFRFHLVSLVAVFLALALGIAMGATVIDKATVDRLQGSLDNVRNEVSAANQRSDQLQRQLDRSNDFENQSSTFIVDGKLRNVPVVVIAVRGIDEGPVKDTRQLATQAGGNVLGTMWITNRNNLDDTGVVSGLARDLEIPSADTNQIRQAVMARISAVMAGATPSTSLKPLTDAGLLDWQSDTGNGDVSKVEFGSARIFVASGARPDVSNDTFARPLVRLLAAQPTRRVVAIESGRDADARTSAERAVFTGALRSDNTVDGKISTVDDIEVLSGRVAAVLSLAQLPGQVGDYGVGSGAGSVIPKIAP